MKSFKILTLVITALITINLISIGYVQSFNAINTVSEAPQEYIMPTVIIDAGHGGIDVGASSKSGISESDINLNIAKGVATHLRFLGFKVIMTREEDISIHDEDKTTIRDKKRSDILNRFKIMQENENVAFISIHLNYYPVSKYSGSQVFYTKNNQQGQDMAQCISDSIKAEVQPNNEREIKSSTNDVYLIYNAKSPAVLVECGFLSNPAEAELLNDTIYQQKMAMAITKGFLNYYKGL